MLSPKSVSLGLAVLLASATLARAATPAAPADDLKDPKAQTSYALGVQLGGSLQRDGVTVDPRIVAEGLQDALSGGTLKMTPDQVRQTLTDLRNSVEARLAAAQQNAAANQAAGDAFLKANETKTGVITLPDGLQYQVLTTGTGAIPRADDTVVCNYRGTLIDGTEFDSSYKRGQPSSFPVSGVIKGWTEALEIMPVGSKWRLFIPASLAYGAAGAGDAVGPNQVLIFDIELLSIQPRQ